LEPEARPLFNPRETHLLRTNLAARRPPYACIARMELDLIEVMSVLKNTGLWTTVGGPVFIYYCIAKLRGKIKLSWYAFVPLMQAYMLTGFYFAVFGPQIVTTHLQTFLYLFLGSNVLTTVLCIIIFFTTTDERPSRVFPMDLKHTALAVFGVYPFFMAFAGLLFAASNFNDHCEGTRCEGALLLVGNFGFTGTLFGSALLMGIGVIWANFLCYIFRPYVSPQKGEKNESSSTS
jgi:hypothetical protein